MLSVPPALLVLTGRPRGPERPLERAAAGPLAFPSAGQNDRRRAAGLHPGGLLAGRAGLRHRLPRTSSRPDSETVRLEREMVRSSRFLAAVRGLPRRLARAGGGPCRAAAAPAGGGGGALGARPRAAGRAFRQNPGAAAGRAAGAGQQPRRLGDFRLPAREHLGAWPAAGLRRRHAGDRSAGHRPADPRPVHDRAVAARFRIAALLGGALVLLLLYLDFGDWRWTALAILPTALTARGAAFPDAALRPRLQSARRDGACRSCWGSRSTKGCTWCTASAKSMATSGAHLGGRRQKCHPHRLDNDPRLRLPDLHRAPRPRLRSPRR